MKSTTTQQIKAADIEQDDWWVPILEAIPDDYARGYLTARVSVFNERLSSLHDEYFREALLEIAGEDDIWGCGRQTCSSVEELREGFRQLKIRAEEQGDITAIVVATTHHRFADTLVVRLGGLSVSESNASTEATGCVP